jgi:hypothetical protein
MSIQHLVAINSVDRLPLSYSVFFEKGITYPIQQLMCMLDPFLVKASKKGKKIITFLRLF